MAEIMRRNRPEKKFIQIYLLFLGEIFQDVLHL